MALLSECVADGSFLYLTPDWWRGASRTPQALPGGGRQGLRLVTETVRGNGLHSMMRGCRVCGKPLPTVVGKMG